MTVVSECFPVSDSYQVAFRKLALLFEGAPGSRGPQSHRLLTNEIIWSLALMNDLDIVAVRIEHPCRIIESLRGRI